MKDKELIEKIEEVIKGLNKRKNKKMCKELHGGCFECTTNIAIAYLREWQDILDY